MGCYSSKIREYDESVSFEHGHSHESSHQSDDSECFESIDGQWERIDTIRVGQIYALALPYDVAHLIAKYIGPNQCEQYTALYKIMWFHYPGYMVRGVDWSTVQYACLLMIKRNSIDPRVIARAANINEEEFNKFLYDNTVGADENDVHHISEQIISLYELVAKYAEPQQVAKKDYSRSTNHPFLVSSPTEPRRQSISG